MYMQLAMQAGCLSMEYRISKLNEAIQRSSFNAFFCMGPKIMYNLNTPDNNSGVVTSREKQFGTGA
jgi:hypothetical protein